MNSYVWGYHAYMDTWIPAVSLEFILKPEPSNYKDKHAVSVLKFVRHVIVRHVPYNLAPRLSQFLRREVNKALLRLRERNKTEEQVRTRDAMCVPPYGPRFTLTRRKKCDLRDSGLHILLCKFCDIRENYWVQFPVVCSWEIILH